MTNLHPVPQTACSLTLPADLAGRIPECKAVLIHATKASRSETGAASVEIERLTCLAADVAVNLDTQKKLAVESDEAAAVAVRLQTRLTAVNEQIEKLVDERNQRTPVTLEAADVLLYEIISFYHKNLPALICKALFPYCGNVVRNRGLALQCDSFTDLAQLRSIQLAAMPATPRNLEWLFAILDRALRGQPSLTSDHAAEAGAPTPSAEPTTADSENL